MPTYIIAPDPRPNGAFVQILDAADDASAREALATHRDDPARPPLPEPGQLLDEHGRVIAGWWEARDV